MNRRLSPQCEHPSGWPLLKPLALHTFVAAVAQSAAPITGNGAGLLNFDHVRRPQCVGGALHRLLGGGGGVLGGIRGLLVDLVKLGFLLLHLGIPVGDRLVPPLAKAVEESAAAPRLAGQPVAGGGRLRRQRQPRSSAAVRRLKGATTAAAGGALTQRRGLAGAGTVAARSRRPWGRRRLRFGLGERRRPGHDRQGHHDAAARCAPTRASAAAELLAGLERCLVTANPVMANFGARTGGPDGAVYTLSAPVLAAQLGTTMITITALQQENQS